MTTKKATSPGRPEHAQGNPSIFPAWVQEKLQSSGIPLHVAEEAEIRPVAAEKAARLLGRNFQKKPCPDAMMIPYCDLDGKPVADGGNPYFRLRFHGEGLEAHDGKRQRYAQSPGSDPHVYIPPGLSDAFRKFPVLVFTEGELKALSATAHGIPTVGLGGIQSWSDPEARFMSKQGAAARGLPVPALDHESPIHHELIQIIDAAKRAEVQKILVLGDSDGRVERDAAGKITKGNSAVESAVKKLAKALQWQCGNIEVYRDFCPNPEPEEGEPEAEKWGLDDWIVAKGEAEVKRVLFGVTSNKFKRAISFSEREHLPMAEWYRAKFRADGTPGLIYWREDFYRWNGLHWAKMEDKPLQADLHRWLERVPIYDKKEGSIAPTRGLAENVWATLQRIAHVATNIDAPFRLTDPPQALPKGRFAVLQNGILDLNSRDLHPATPELFQPNPLSFDYQPGASCPGWERFLSTLWPDSPESVELLKQWAGYLISGDTSRQKILFMIGPRRSGKGTILRVFTDLLGPENVTSALLTGLGGDFGLANLAGKALACFPDARLTGQADQGPIVERLLSISGEDAILVNRKYRDALTMRIPSRLILVSNELPKLTDASGALVSRLLILKMTESFYGREDHALSDRLIRELPGIFNWALAGLDDLTASGRFTEPETSKGIREDAERLSSPVFAFVQDCCLIGPNYRVIKTNLYQAWKTWCEEAGHHPGSDAMFSRNLSAAIQVEEFRPRENDGTRPHCWIGVGLTFADKFFAPSGPPCPASGPSSQSPENGSGPSGSTMSSISETNGSEKNQETIPTPHIYMEPQLGKMVDMVDMQAPEPLSCWTDAGPASTGAISDDSDLPVEDI